MERRLEATQSGYERPTLSVLGSVHELTLTDKTLGTYDGFTFLNQPICNTSICHLG
jgi:hypothetical protein